MAALAEHRPAPMIPLLDRPFLQHLVENLVQQGPIEIDFILSHRPEKVEEYFEEGKRWGSIFRYHLARDADHPYDFLRTLDFDPGDDAFLLGHADQLPKIDLAWAPSTARSTPLIYCWREEPPAGGSAREALEGVSAGMDECTSHLDGNTYARTSSEADRDDRSAPTTQFRRAAVPTKAGFQWAGWVWLSSHGMSSLPSGLDRSGFEELIMAHVEDRTALIEVNVPLDCRTFAGLLRSHQRFFTGDVPGLMCSGWEAERGIWLSRNVSINPTARLIPPVYIGENCSVNSRAQIGPNATIGKNCLLDNGCQVENSIVADGSFVGETTELNNVIVDRNRLINIRLETDVYVADDFILGNVSEVDIRRFIFKAFSRVAALALLFAYAPLILAIVAMLKIRSRKPVVRWIEAVRLPANSVEALWQTFRIPTFLPNGARAAGFKGFLLHFLPGLWSVAKGDMSFVGVSPRSRDAIAKLPHNWSDLYLKSKVGLVTEADVMYKEPPTLDELYAAETVYSVTAGLTHDLKLLAKHFINMIGLR